MSNYLAITIADLMAEQNPLGDPNLFTIGDNQYPVALAEAKIAYWDDYVTSRVPEKYRLMFDQVVGEIIVEYAEAGQQAAKLGLTPVVEGSVVLYRNLWSTYRVTHDNRRRSMAMAVDAFSVDCESGEVTFAAPLAAGDIVVADYRHTATAGLLYLRGIAINLITADIMETMPSFAGNILARIEDMRRQAYTDLDRLKRGEAGLALFDKLKLVDEYETRNTGQMAFPTVGGYL